MKQNNKPYDVLGSVFDNVMQRESQIITAYRNGEESEVFFRNKKNTSGQGYKSEIYYYAEQNVRGGLLIVINDLIYLTLNRSTAENTLYKRSDLLECNIVIETVEKPYNPKLIIPGFSHSLTSVFGNNSPRISTVSGNMQVKTEDCEVSRQIKIGETVNALDCEWQVTDVIPQSGIMNIYIKKQAVTPLNDIKDVVF